MMSDQTCACGNIDGTNAECERCRLIAQLTAAQQRVAGYVEQIKLLQAEVDELRAIKFKRFSHQECWIYQGDGEDHLEGLVCPVVVSPQKMIELEKAQQRVAELERENELLLVRYRGEYEALKYTVRAAIFTLEKALNE